MPPSASGLEHQMSITISPASVRYIKLGEGGRWEKACLDQGIIRIGFGSAKPDRFRLCQERRWSELRKSFGAEGKKKGKDTQASNELQIFFEDDGSTLWITFVGQRLYWGLVDQTQPKPHPDLHGVY